MTSATAACEIATFETLDARIEGAPVYQDVPDNAPLPIVNIGDLLAIPFAGADDPDRRITLTIGVETDGDERAPCSDLLDQVEALLAGKSLHHDGWDLHFSLVSSAAELTEDGSGYLGIAIFQVLAFSDA